MLPASQAARPPLSDRFLRFPPRTVMTTLPRYERRRVTPGIAHIGVGNFHRAHQALYVERCLHLPGHESWGIVGIGLGVKLQEVVSVS
nr:hypothetical protein [uncultured Massilia sp.]